MQFPTTEEVIAEVRSQYLAARSKKDPETVKYLLSEGRQRLKQLSEMLGLATGTL